MKKDWRDMSDNELDDFFRKGLDDPEIPFVQEDWEKMKTKMTVVPNGRMPAWFNRFKIPVLISALVIIGSGLWYAKNHSEMGGMERTAAPSAHVIDQITEERGLARLNELSEDSSETFQNEEMGKISPSEYLEKSNEPSNAGANQIKGFLDSEGDGHRVQTTSPNVENSREEITPIIGMDEKKGMINSSFQEFKPIITLTYEKNANSSDKGTAKKEKREFHQVNRWSLSAVLSPDVSALKLNDIQGLGTSAGISLEYFVHPKWSINLGGLYAFKTYQADEGYKIPPGYGAKPIGVSGDCYIIDIPLNIRFYAINGQLDKWYVSSGLSSYWMLREKYELAYGNQAYPDYYNVDIKNENRHYLQVVNISMGYERVLSEKLSLQVEPYFKVPLSGVGEGQVSLKSAGALIGLKYSWR